MGKILGLSIQNYGSLKNIRMGKLWNDKKEKSVEPLSNLVAIIGPSGNGKSTFADAFGFISDCLEKYNLSRHRLRIDASVASIAFSPPRFLRKIQ